MTTNSPTPVNGDVQALVTDCEREIAIIKQELSRYSQLPHAVQETISLLDSQLKRQQVALAALTASPVGWTDAQELRDVEKDGCGYIFSANPITPHADERRVLLLYPNLLAHILAAAPDNFGQNGPI